MATALFLLGNTFSLASLQNPVVQPAHERSIIWDGTLSFNEPGGKYDYTVFGEAPDAHDGLPMDSYDVIKPPAPMPPFLRAWFSNSLPSPFNMLWKDYREYPDDLKIWTVKVMWAPLDEETPTTVTISWDPSMFDDSEYTIVTFCMDDGTPLKNMLVDTSYTFTCPAETVQVFKVVCLLNNPPVVPNSPDPVDESINVPITSQLSWAGGDPDGDPVTYDVFFGETSPPPLLVHNQSAQSYDPGTLSYQQTYYWRIVAWDNHSWSATGPVWQFTTIPLPNDPPYVPSDPDPLDNAVDVSINVTLSWTGGDPNDDPVTYDVYFGDVNPPPKIAANISEESYTPDPLFYDTLYYWEIIAWDDQGASTEGPQWRFTTQGMPNRPPYVPSDPNPVDEAVNESVHTVLSWTGGDPDGDTVTYAVYFGTNSTPPLVTSQQTTSYDPGTLLYNTTYYWQIVSHDPSNASTSGPVWSFITGEEQDVTPPYVKITNPLSGHLYLNIADFIVINFKFFTTLIIGKITISVDASDNQSGIRYVEIYLDDNLQATLNKAPYNWTWTARGHGFPYTIKAVAYDNAGNSIKDEVKTWKIF